MSFFTNLRADRLITEIKVSHRRRRPGHAESHRASCESSGPGGDRTGHRRPSPDADKIATVAFVEVLTGLVNQKTFPKFIEGMVEGSPRVIAGVAWALTSSRNYPPHLLLEALNTAGIAKSALLDVITAQQQPASACASCWPPPTSRRPTRRPRCSASSASSPTDNDLPELSAACRARTRSRACTSSTSCRASTKPRGRSARCSSSCKDPNKLIRARHARGAGSAWTARSTSSALRAAARSRDRRAEQGHRRRSSAPTTRRRSST